MAVQSRPVHLGPSDHGLATPRILLLGSDSVVSRALQLFLRSEGYETVVVRADREGWSLSKTASPDLILVDPTVSLQRRAQARAHFRDNPSTQPVPIVALLDLADAADQNAMEYADVVLTWPFRLKEVLVLIEELLAARVVIE